MGSIQKANSMFSNDIILLFIASEPNPEWIERFESRWPGLQVRWVNSHPDSGAMSPDDVAAETWDGVTIYSSWLEPSPKLVPKVRYVQLSSAGADRWLNHDLYLNPDVVFCSANGIHP